jgi:outer membrane immunogenic protein
MNKFLLGSLAVVLTSVSAAAADMMAKAPIVKAPVAVAYDWTGFYLGGYWGTSLGQSRATTPGGFTDVADITKAGWTAGGTAGVNWQAGRNWLVGLEGDIGYLANDRRFNQWNDIPVTVGVKTGGYATARARFGYVTGPSLLYLTGGAAFVQVEDTFGSSGGVINPVAVSNTKTGWTVGGGIESKISQNWTRKTEYLYIDSGTTNFVGNPYAGPQNVSFRNQFHVIKSGINYKFGGPSEPIPFFGGPMQPTDHNWAGFYAGVNAGGGLTTSTASAVLPFGGHHDIRGAGAAGGVQAGYNFMNLFGRPNFFAGVEADIGYLGVRASEIDWNDNFIFSQKTGWYGTARGRIGTTSGPSLFYVTGGAAFVQVRNGFEVNPAFPPPPGTIITNDVRSETRAGWTFGGGTEVALDARWSAKLEYLYIDAGKSHRTFTALIPATPLVTVENDFRHRFHVIRAGLNYSFNAPVVAKY